MGVMAEMRSHALVEQLLVAVEVAHSCLELIYLQHGSAHQVHEKACKKCRPLISGHHTRETCREINI